MMAPLVIACAADRRYAVPLAVMLRSLASHLSPERRVEVHAIDDGVTPDDKARVLASLNGRVTLHWVQPSRSAFAGLPTWGRLPVTTYQRLTLAEWLPAGTERAIWLDCDLLVLDDLAQLWDSDLGDRHALAVQDQRIPFVSSRFGVTAYRDLGLPAGAKYFNAGVLVIDVARWRRDNVAGRAIEYLKTHRDRVFFLDQEALNVVLAGKWGELDSQWNRHPTVDYLLHKEAPRTAGCITHFSGNLKPWSRDGSSPYHELYFQYLDQTAWTGWRPVRNWRGMVLEAYESSRLRRLLYPTEHWATRMVRILTRKYDRNGEE
jgi:lipopolysaccharide biosynthesis glycosyltransferase